jgi:hypothetical protein
MTSRKVLCVYDYTTGPDLPHPSLINKGFTVRVRQVRFPATAPIFFGIIRLYDNFLRKPYELSQYSSKSVFSHGGRPVLCASCYIVFHL